MDSHRIRYYINIKLSTLDIVDMYVYLDSILPGFSNLRYQLIYYSAVYGNRLCQGLLKNEWEANF